MQFKTQYVRVYSCIGPVPEYMLDSWIIRSLAYDP